MDRKYLIGAVGIVLVIVFVSVGLFNYKPAEQQEAAHGKIGHVDVNINESDFPNLIASINGVEIDRKRYIGAVKGAAESMAMSGKKLDDDTMAKLKTDVLDHLIGGELLYQAAVAENIKVADEKLNAEFERVSKRFKEDPQFKERLQKQNVDESNLRGELEKGLMINQLLMENIPANAEVSEEKLKSFYEENKSKMLAPDMVRARHILIKLPPQPKPEDVAEAEKKINSAVEELKGGAKFEDMVKKYSQDTGPSGGDLGLFPRGAMVKEFEDAVFSMKAGDPGKVVRTRFGFHYVEVTEKKDAGTEPYEKVRGRIFAQMQMMEKNRLLQEFIKGLRGKADVKTFM